jgi:hypothetical protein
VPAQGISAVRQLRLLLAEFCLDLVGSLSLAAQQLPPPWLCPLADVASTGEGWWEATLRVTAFVLDFCCHQAQQQARQSKQRHAASHSSYLYNDHTMRCTCLHTYSTVLYIQIALVCRVSWVKYLPYELTVLKSNQNKGIKKASDRQLYHSSYGTYIPTGTYRLLA